MIGQGLKNYLKNLKFIFNPLGTIALGFVIGLSLLIPLAVGAINTMVESVKEIFTNANVDFVAVKDSLIKAFQTLNWNEPMEAVKLMLSRDWLMQTLQICLTSFVGSMDVYTVPLTEVINTFCNTLIGGFVGLVVFVILGVIGGYFLVKCLVRRNSAKRTFKKYILANLIDNLLSFLLIFICVWLYTIWKYSVFITSIIIFILFGFIALIEGYFVHGNGEVKFIEVVNFKNIIKLFAVDLIILAITALFVGELIAITNILVGIFVGIALVQIAFAVLDLNAETYVISLVGKKLDC